QAWGGGFRVPGAQMEAEGESCRLTVSESFFKTFGIPILQGRALEAVDAADAPRAVVVNEKLVQTYLGGRNPVGLIFSLLGLDWRIVGVCADAKYDNIKRPAQPTAYLPFRQMFWKPSISKNLNIASIAIRTSLPASALSTTLR